MFLYGHVKTLCLLCVLVPGCLSLTPGSAFSDTIYLQNDRQVKGAVVYRTYRMVRIRTHSGAVFEIPPSSILRMEAETDLDVLIYRVSTYLAADEIGPALEALEAAQKAYPDAPELLDFEERLYERKLGKCLAKAQRFLERGEFESAVKEIQPVLEDAPAGQVRKVANDWLADAFVGKAEEEIDHIRYGSASEVLARGVKMGVRSAELHLLIARMHENQGRYPLAGEEYALALSIDSGLREARAGLKSVNATIARLGLKKVDPIERSDDMVALGEQLTERIKKSTVSKYRFPEREEATVISRPEFDQISRFISQNSGKFDPIILDASRRFEVEEAWIKAIIMAESSFNSGAMSPVGAKGLMQLMDGTARDMGVGDSLDPVENIMGGTRYFRMMLNMFDNDPELALAAYNAGPGTIRIYKGIPPYKETQNYIRKVGLYYQYFRYQSGRAVQ